MKKHSYISHIIAMIFILSGCIPKPIDIELEQLEQKPVVWSQIAPGNFIFFYFARSFSALNEYQEDTGNEEFLNQILVEDGSLFLTHEGNTEELTQLSPGIWVTDGISTPLIAGDYYTLKGTDSLLEESISSTTRLMPTITLSNQFSSTFIGDDSTKISTIEYQINDVPGDNWYLINVYSGDLESFGNLNNDTTASPTIEVAWDILTDKVYDTYNITNEIMVFDYPSDTMVMTLSNITEEYYNYLALRKRGGSLFNQLSGEPINYPTNVENGYGYFNLVIPDFKVVVLE